MTHSWRSVSDHFEPEDKDPKAQRAVRGRLEAIDYAAYTANRAVIGAALAGVDGKKFETMALATAQARARWVATGVAVTEAGRTPSPEQIAELARLRTVYDELTQVYEALRRLVERGYLEY
jgi:hypothetical protein